MFTRKLLRVLLIASVTLLTFNISPGAAEELSFQPLPEAAALIDMGSAFTYQGRLLDGTNPANGVYDFSFILFDDDSGGFPIRNALKTLTVTNGLFITEVDFQDPTLFDGSALWMQIDVRVSGETEYTHLSPRQKINPVPYATFARTIFRRTVVVKPVGTPAENGTALLNALGSITGEYGANPYLIKLEPGMYDIGGNSLVMKDFVDIEGSGESNTIIFSTGYESYSEASVIGANYAELRNVSIQSISDGDDPYVTAFFCDGKYPVLIHVSIEAHNGISNTNGMIIENSHGELESVSINVESDSGTVMGIDNYQGNLEIRNSSLTIKGGNSSSYGIVNEWDSFLNLYDTSISISTNETGIVNLYAVVNTVSSILNIDNSVISAKGNLTGDVIGVQSDAPTKIYDSLIEASDSGYETAAIDSAGDELFVINSTLTATNSSQYTTGIWVHGTPTIIRNSEVQARDGTVVIGLRISGNPSNTYEISHSIIEGSGATPTGSAEPASNTNYGVFLEYGGDFLFYHDIIRTEPDISGNSLIEGGVGLFNDRGNLTFENSTINNNLAQAFIGLAHVYSNTTNNQARVNNSEIYTCNDLATCSTVYLDILSAPPPAVAIQISNSLLWGGKSNGGLPYIACLWVGDEYNDGFGWPAMGTIAADYSCP